MVGSIVVLVIPFRRAGAVLVVAEELALPRARLAQPPRVLVGLRLLAPVRRVLPALVEENRLPAEVETVAPT